MSELAQTQGIRGVPITSRIKARAISIAPSNSVSKKSPVELINGSLMNSSRNHAQWKSNCN